MNVLDIFESGGALSRSIPGYAPREGQIAGAEAVYSTIRDGGRLIVEAPTGVGKSAMVLGPILALGRKAIVATANISLSEQYVQKDFPLLASAVGSGAKCALAKGLNNYVCMDAVNELENAGGEAGRVRDWALGQTETGDFSELPFVPRPETLRVLARSSDDCLRRACDHFEDCYGLGARRAAQEADVVVTNYHMLFAHLEILENGGAEGILPEADVLVLDEAHKISEIARGFVGNRVTEGGVRRALSLLAPKGASRHSRTTIDEDLQRKALSEVAHVFSRLRQLRTGRIRDEGAVGASGCSAALDGATGAYGDAIRAATDLPLPDGQLFGPVVPGKLQSWYVSMRRRGDEKGAAGYVERLRISGRTLRRAAHALRSADRLLDPGEVVHYTEKTEGGDGRQHVALCSSPIEVGPYLKKRIWDAAGERSFRSVIAMSATLRDGKESFAHVVRELGAEGAQTLAVESPFDFSRCMVVCDSTWPEPKDPKFAGHLVESLAETIRVAGGRTLALFASWRALNETHRALAQRVPDGGSVFSLAQDGRAGRIVRILKQGEAPRTELVRRFKEDEHSCLFGVESFWAGIDAPGRACSAVWIEKLPFATPDDPIFDALNAKYGREAFMKYSVPRAVLQLRQGFGRLIRSMEDAGVVVIADPRIFTASYGKRFTSVLPPACVAGDLEDARFHLEEYLRYSSPTVLKGNQPK